MSVPVTAWEHTCGRCQNVWVSRLEHPLRCAKCRSPYWERTRRGEEAQLPVPVAPLALAREEEEGALVFDQKLTAPVKIVEEEEKPVVPATIIPPPPPNRTCKECGVRFWHPNPKERPNADYCAVCWALPDEKTGYVEPYTWKVSGSTYSYDFRDGTYRGRREHAQ